MRNYLFIIISVFMVSSRMNNELRHPHEIFASSADTALRNVNGTWFFHNDLFSGFIVEHYRGQSNIMLAKIPIVDGKENGWATEWYINRKKRIERYFVNGEREGTHRGWWENGKISFINHFHHDQYEGAQLGFYKNGKRWQETNYVNGYEEGQQRAWDDKGLLVTNFTVKNGKLYGIIGRFDCMSIESAHLK